MSTTRRDAVKTIALGGVALLLGCDGPDATASDAAVDPIDASGRDAAATDGGVTDASSGDAASTTDDAFVETHDAGPPPFVLGETKPTAANTGLNVEGIAVDALTVVEGNVIHSTSDMVFERMRFLGRVQVRAARITYRNCWFNASHEAGHELVSCQNASCEDIVFENCLFQPSSFGTVVEASLENCIFGHDFSLVRCDLSGGIDIIGLYGGSTTAPARNVEILGSYLHDLVYYSPDPGHDDNQTHNDVVQVHYGCDHLRVFGSNLEAKLNPAEGDASTPPVTDAGGEHLSGNPNYPATPAMSGLMFSPVNAAAGVRDVEVDRSWLGGGICFFNWPRTDGVDVRITNNRWGDDTILHGGDGSPMYILMRRDQTATITGNVMEATGEPYDRRHDG